MNRVTADDLRLAANWAFVRDQLPRAPARVAEIGCGPLGGFVPALVETGYDAVGVDPEAPHGPTYHQDEFEAYAPASPVDAVVACTSLHHVGNLDEVLGKVEGALSPPGCLIVVEWDWQRFDEQTAQWCFDRLPAVPVGSEPGWLHTHRNRWLDSRLPWDDYLRDWGMEHGLHTGGSILAGLERRFDRVIFEEVPYFFEDLVETSEGDEQKAIDTGHIRANGIRYVGRARAGVNRRPPRPPAGPAPRSAPTTAPSPYGPSPRC